MLQPTKSGLHRPTLTIGLALFALATITFFDARSMNIRSSYGMGADAASYFIAAFLGLLGLGHVVAALRPGLEAERSDWRAVGWVSLALFALVAVIWIGGGFILASALLFAFTARAFGRQALLKDLAIGVVLGIAIFLLFNKLLTLALPMGPFERLM